MGLDKNIGAQKRDSDNITFIASVQIFSVTMPGIRLVLSVAGALLSYLGVLKLKKR